MLVQTSRPWFRLIRTEYVSGSDNVSLQPPSEEQSGLGAYVWLHPLHPLHPLHTMQTAYMQILLVLSNNGTHHDSLDKVRGPVAQITRVEARLTASLQLYAPRIRAPRQASLPLVGLLVSIGANASDALHCLPALRTRLSLSYLPLRFPSSSRSDTQKGSWCMNIAQS